MVVQAPTIQIKKTHCSWQASLPGFSIKKGSIEGEEELKLSCCSGWWGWLKGCVALGGVDGCWYCVGWWFERGIGLVWVEVVRSEFGIGWVMCGVGLVLVGYMCWVSGRLWDIWVRIIWEVSCLIWCVRKLK